MELFPDLPRSIKTTIGDRRHLSKFFEDIFTPGNFIVYNKPHRLKTYRLYDKKMNSLGFISKASFDYLEEALQLYKTSPKRWKFSPKKARRFHGKHAIKRAYLQYFQQQKEKLFCNPCPPVVVVYPLPARTLFPGL